MSKILSQDEVDALLSGVESGSIETETKKEAPADGVKLFDLASPEKVVRGRMQGLEMVQEKFNRLYRDSLSTQIKKFVDIKVKTIETIKFGDFIKTIPMPSSINIFKMEPLKGTSLFIIEAPTVFAFVECFFGSPSVRYVKSEGRYFTPIEQKIIRKLVDAALNDLKEGWKTIIEISPQFVSSEMNPQFVNIVTSSEIVIKIEMEVYIEDFSGKMFFCIPFSMLEPIRDKLYSVVKKETHEIDQNVYTIIKDALLSSMVNIIVELGKTEMTIKDMKEMKVGHVIVLKKNVSEELDIKVEGVLKLKGILGIHKGSQAVKITKIIDKTS